MPTIHHTPPREGEEGIYEVLKEPGEPEGEYHDTSDTREEQEEVARAGQLEAEYSAISDMQEGLKEMIDHTPPQGEEEKIYAVLEEAGPPEEEYHETSKQQGQKERDTPKTSREGTSHLEQIEPIVQDYM